MPIPHPPGYQPPRPSRVDRRRVLLAGCVLALMAAVLLVLVAAGCGAWGERMRQLAAITRSRNPED